jgi:hypothetical protein
MELASAPAGQQRELHSAEQFALAQRREALLSPGCQSVAVTPRNITDPYAFSSNAVVDADRANKTGEAISRRGGGGSAPTNPCGG